LCLSEIPRVKPQLWSGDRLLGHYQTDGRRSEQPREKFACDRPFVQKRSDAPTVIANESGSAPSIG